MAQQQSTFWSRTKKGGKLGFDKLYTLVDKLGPPVNKLSNKLGAEAFWPTTLDKECDKAARILRSFCKDGFYQEEQQRQADGPTAKQRVLKKIPTAVIRDAKGIAIFTTMRTGLWVSGAGGSGIIMSRLPDGSWSPPSGIMLHTAGLGFLAGVDIYDCVLVINTSKAMQAFQKLRCTIGGEVSAVAGPVGAGGIIESEIHKRQTPVFTYLKSRGFYAGVQIDGTVMLERNDENERFYHEKLSAQEILTGKVRHAPQECWRLLETVKAAQGDRDVDQNLLPSEPPPSDFEIDDDSQMFGVPSKDDPDPYGVLQLEKEGMLIREAGTHKRASWEQFTFKPSPTSPVFDTFEGRKSRDHDSIHGRLSGRNGSIMSTNGLDSGDASGRVSRASSRTYVTMADSSTQTDDIPPTPTSEVLPTPTSPIVSPSSPGRSSIRSGSTRSHRPSMDEIPEDKPTSPPSSDGRVALGPLSKRRSGHSRSSLINVTSSVINGPPSPEASDEDLTKRKSLTNADAPIDGRTIEDDSADDSADMASDDEADISGIVEEPVVVHQVQKATAPQVICKARLVTVPKRIPPTLPERNPNRARPRDLDRNNSAASSNGHIDDSDVASISDSLAPVEKISSSTYESDAVNDTVPSSNYESETDSVATSGAIATKSDHLAHVRPKDMALPSDNEDLEDNESTFVEHRRPETPVKAASPVRSRSPQKTASPAKSMSRARTESISKGSSPARSSIRMSSPAKSIASIKSLERPQSPEKAQSPLRSHSRATSPVKILSQQNSAKSSPRLGGDPSKNATPGKLVIPGAFQSVSVTPDEVNKRFQ